MESVLVTGGAGFIGAAFVRAWLASEGGYVVNLDSLSYSGDLGRLDGIAEPRRHRFVQGDIADGPLVRRLLGEHRPRAIVHFAAESHVDRSIDSPAQFVRTNVLGTHVLLEAALEHWQSLSAGQGAGFRFLHVSTDEVYGSLGAAGAFTEQSRYAPNSPYAASKAAADHFVRAFHHTYGLPVIVTNCSNNYGPYQFPEKLIPLVILNCLEGKPLPVYGDGGQVRDWLYVDDHCEALRLVLARGAVGQTYNIGGRCQRTNLEVVRSICELVDAARGTPPERASSARITFVDDRPGHDRRYAIDPTKIEQELGWRPRTGFAAGLAATVGWYIEHEDWARRVTAGGYQRERLGLGRRGDRS